MPQLIAEIGWNHMGDMQLASTMVREASLAGAHYAKFQTWQVSRLKPGSWDTDGRRQIYEGAELSLQDHEYLIEQCSKFNIQFLSSVFSVPDAILLNSLGINSVKIPSFESTNLELLRYVAENFENIIISVGTATLDEIKTASDILPSSATFMHCVSSYPCHLNQINLPRISHIQSLGLNAGFSDHTQGITASVLALGYNPAFIEKHFTVDQNLPGRDNKFAILPSQLKELSSYVQAFEEVTVDHGIEYQLCESDSRQNYRGRFDG